MFFCFVLLSFSSVFFLPSFAVSGCDMNCADKPVFTPSRLVVKHGDPTSATCSVCQSACTVFGLEYSVGKREANGNTISWEIDNMTEWGTKLTCYYTENVTDVQCCSELPVTVYKPPDSVSISVDNHSGPMFEGRQYSLLCTVHNVAPVKNLNVTFYRGKTQLGQTQSISSTQNKPVTEIYNLTITPSKEDDGAQYWCKAKLELGPEGPQPPPVVMSQNINNTFYYKPQLDPPLKKEIVATAGRSVHLNCSAQGNPRPSYTWTLPAHLPPFNGSVLTISSADCSDEGQYMCVVNNTMGSAEVLFNLQVRADYMFPVIVFASGLSLVIVTTIVLYCIFKCTWVY